MPRPTFPATCAAILALAGVLTVSSASAEVPLRDQSEISEGIIMAAIAYEIGDKCDSIDVRLLRGIGFLEGLRARARELGYSDSEIRSYMDDRAEKQRLETEARARLAAMGAVPGQWETYCAVGRDHIAAGNQIGYLLR